MQWSNIVKQNQSENENVDVTVLNYTPKQFNFGTAGAALDYLNEKKLGSDFVMSDVLRTTTGVEEIERQSEEQKIELKVLDKIALVQEEAYQKAYELGFEEGTEKAILDKSQELAGKSAELDALLLSLNKVKEEMAHQNEAHILKMIYAIATKLAFDHINENDDVVLKLIKKSIEQAQADENVNVLISNKQLEYLEQMKLEDARDNEFLRKVKFQGSDKISVGSCVVETNYGVIDARIEERISKLWLELKPSVPKIKNSIESV